MATPNMGLTLPAPSITPGPTWASELNDDLTLLDVHDHTTGKGMRVPVAGLNIDDELKFNKTTPNGLPATGLSRVGLMSPQSPPVATGIYSDIAGDLYYDNAAGIPVQITSGSSIVGTAGSISGMTPESSASFNGGTGTFIWQKDATLSEAATMDCGPLRIRDGTASANAITVTPPAGLASAYTLTLPPSAPASQRILTANAGASTFAATDSTLTLTSSLLKVADLGIGNAQLASGSVSSDKLALASVTTAKIADGNVTQVKWGAKSISYSSSIVLAQTASTTPTPIPGLSVSVSLRAGHTVCVQITPSLGVFYANCALNAGSSTNPSLLFDVDIITPSTTVTYPVSLVRGNSNAGIVYSPVNVFSFMYLPPQTGVFTFIPSWFVDSSVNTGMLAHARLAVYEM